MNDRRLGELLRSLPRPQASEDFTGRVLARLHDEQRRPRPVVRPWMAAAAAALALAALAPFSARWLAPERSLADERAQLGELQREHRQLEQELSSLMSLGGDADDVVYLGGDDDVALVVDLDRLAGNEPYAQPAALRERPN
jgi:hypothetical protein